MRIRRQKYRFATLYEALDNLTNCERFPSPRHTKNQSKVTRYSNIRSQNTPKRIYLFTRHHFVNCGSLIRIQIRSTMYLTWLCDKIRSFQVNDKFSQPFIRWRWDERHNVIARHSHPWRELVQVDTVDRLPGWILGCRPLFKSFDIWHKVLIFCVIVVIPMCGKSVERPINIANNMRLRNGVYVSNGQTKVPIVARNNHRISNLDLGILERRIYSLR